MAIINVQTGEPIKTCKGRNRVGSQNHQCSTCRSFEDCKNIYNYDMWDAQGNCPEYAKMEKEVQK